MDAGFDMLLEAFAAASQEERAKLREEAEARLALQLGQSLEDRIHSSALPDGDWLRAVCLAAGEAEDPFQVNNAYDGAFYNIICNIWKHSEEELLESMLASLRQVRQKHPDAYQVFATYFNRFPFWGSFDPDRGDYTAFARRAAACKRHSYDFLWLWCRLEDYISRMTLLAILANWIYLSMDLLVKFKSPFFDYWEPDIFPGNRGDVLVDLGAYVGDSLLNYSNMYGLGYKKIYAYEISAESVRELRANIPKWNLHDVEIRQKGAGREHGRMYVRQSAESGSANRLAAEGPADRSVEVVALDEDITEPVSCIKMDIEGSEQEALLGAERIIREQMPKLAVCVYHGYDDLWKIPLMIDGMVPEYRFYLRHNGGNVIPTEFVLLCKYPDTGDASE